MSFDAEREARAGLGFDDDHDDVNELGYTTRHLFGAALLRAYDAGRAEGEPADLALRNVLMLATLMRRAAQQGRERNGVDDAEHLIRFCKAAGVVPVILREAEGGGS